MNTRRIRTLHRIEHKLFIALCKGVPKPMSDEVLARIEAMAMDTARELLPTYLKRRDGALWLHRLISTGKVWDL